MSRQMISGPGRRTPALDQPRTGQEFIREVIASPGLDNEERS